MPVRVKRTSQGFCKNVHRMLSVLNSRIFTTRLQEWSWNVARFETGKLQLVWQNKKRSFAAAGIIKVHVISGYLLVIIKVHVFIKIGASVEPFISAVLRYGSQEFKELILCLVEDWVQIPPRQAIVSAAAALQTTESVAVSPFLNSGVGDNGNTRSTISQHAWEKDCACHWAMAAMFAFNRYAKKIIVVRI